MNISNKINEKGTQKFSLGWSFIGLLCTVLTGLLPTIILTFALVDVWDGHEVEYFTALIAFLVFCVVFGFVWNGFKSTRSIFSFTHAFIGIFLGIATGFYNSLNTKFILFWPVKLVALIIYHSFAGYFACGSRHHLNYYKYSAKTGSYRYPESKKYSDDQLRSIAKDIGMDSTVNYIFDNTK